MKQTPSNLAAVRTVVAKSDDPRKMVGRSQPLVLQTPSPYSQVYLRHTPANAYDFMEKLPAHTNTEPRGLCEHLRINYC